MTETTDEHATGRAAPNPPARARRRPARALAAAGVALLALAAAGTCALPPPGLPHRPLPPGAAPGTAVTMPASTRYDGSIVRRWMLGDGYRALWGTPVRVEVLDLASAHGGLTPVRRGGGNQTRSLQLRGGDGRRYAFRSVDKDQGGDLPALSRATIGRVRQDQIGALHPAGALVAAELARRAGVPHAQPRLAVLPADAALGEFRAEFGGMLGILEEYPSEARGGGPGFAGSSEIVGTEELDSAVATHPGDAVDAPAYLAARLLDVYLNDWDRHEDQWRWARLERGGAHRWVAIPRDRDYALVDYRGAIPWAARLFEPKVVRLDTEYRDLEGLLVDARPLDTRFLCPLPAAAWDSVAGAVRDSLGDGALTSAVRKMPPEYARVDGARLLRLLRARRDALPEAARRFRTVLRAETCREAASTK